MAESEVSALPHRREPSYADAIIPLVMPIVLIGGAVMLFGIDADDGPMMAGRCRSIDFVQDRQVTTH